MADFRRLITMANRLLAPMVPAVVLLLVATSQPADAQSRTCLRLERQLASLSQNSGSSNPLKLLQYNGAILRQKVQIKQANRQLRRSKCSNSAKQTSRTRASCRRINRSLDEMQSNLKQLRAKRNRLTPSGRRSTRNQRARIRRSLETNGCYDREPVFASRSGVRIETPARRRSIVDQLYNDRGYGWDERNRREYNSYDPYDQIPGVGPRGDTYQTMCVRTCDGYYFPISFSTTPQNFERDVNSCSAKCPGTNTELYFYSTRGENAEDMVSYMTNEPYTALQTAFSYRQQLTPDCSCKFGEPNILFEIVGRNNDETDKPVDSFIARIATPVFRVDPGEDPETLANQRGAFVPKTFSLTAKNNRGPADGGKRKIRVVGEVFFPNQ